ncbi:MAG: hypothetical protein U0Z75_09110 [Deinococcaceae bacterium]
MCTLIAIEDIDSYSDKLQYLFDLRIILRALIESKWSQESYDDEIIGSETVSKYANCIVSILDKLESNLFENQGLPNKSWLVIKDTETRAYKVMVTKIKSMKNIGKSVWPSHNPEDKEKMTRIYFSPYELAKEIVSNFINEIDND